MSEPPASRTRGFLFADLRDYTRYVEFHGDRAAAELLARYRLIVRDVVARFDGAEIRTEGDGFFVVFSSASAAVQGGLAILEAAETASIEAEDAAIRIGIGVHAGETAETPDGYVGSAVNLAARICALAGPGELLVSDTVRGLARTFLALQFVPRGRRRLKGIAEPVLVYQVLPSTAAAGRPRRSRLLVATAIGIPLALLAAVVLLRDLPGPGPGRPVGASGAGSPSGSNPPRSGDPGTSATSNPLLTADERRLFDRLPAAVKQDCASESVAGGSAGGAVSLHCRLPLSAGADEVWVDQFPTPESLSGAFSEAVTRARAPAGDCETAPLANHSWEVPDVLSGKLLCYPQEGAAWLVWTYDLERILVKARRGGGDWRGLYAWWHQTAIFLRLR